MTEEEIQKLIRKEIARALIILRDEVGNTPQRADGNLNGRDFYETLNLVEQKMRP